ncbi:MAG: S8 family serine peptidase [Planctomycetota bacterium]|jgi:hypothetical protein
MKKRFLYSAERRGFRVATVFFCALLPAFSFAVQESTSPNGSNVQAVHDLGYTGQGVSVGLISANHALDSHEAFAGQAFLYDATDTNPYDPIDHDTSVGGSICSRGGVSYPDDKGTAPDAVLHSIKVSDNGSVSTVYITDALDYLLGQQCQVVVTGIQLPSGPSSTPDGMTIWSLIYDYYAYEHDLVFATAAGNGESAVTIFGDTYNSITTGGLIVDTNDVYYRVGSTSNPGPTADGRNKPDIVAPSEGQWTPKAASDISWADATPGSGGQTSWSVPHTGGVAAVLLSYADTSPEANDNQNEVIKAVIVNSAFPNIQDKSGNITTLQTWNSDRGYGRIDALRAFQTLSEGEVLPGTVISQKGWAYQTMTKRNGVDEYQINGLKNERLILTVTWDRQVTRSILGNYAEESEPKFNLDLTIKSPQGLIIFSETDTLNNLQKADILLPEDGFYDITLTNTTTKRNRSYAIAFEVLPPLVADFNVDYVVDIDDLLDFVPYWLNMDCTGDCFPYDISSNGTIDLSDFSIFAQQWLDYDNRYYSP